ncbi:hypothetical protein R1sor_011678 [Riccia sorocarpa]|uniref:Peptidase A1 domain-containing protein n=1 Tax=Riccia sorocarpa TaxID=122646 RepID=A0ABD3I5J9_9MARC
MVLQIRTLSLLLTHIHSDSTGLRSTASNYSEYLDENICIVPGNKIKTITYLTTGFSKSLETSRHAGKICAVAASRRERPSIHSRAQWHGHVIEVAASRPTCHCWDPFTAVDFHGTNARAQLPVHSVRFRGEISQLMRRVTAVKLLAVLLVCCSSLVTRWSEAKLALPFYHKFSHKAKQEHYARGLGNWPYPDPNTVDFRRLLHHHDLMRHGRKLAEAQPTAYTLLDGNFTLQIFAGLYYATIAVGTPDLPFLVALDTGSDLFWLPCECESCAPASSPAYADYYITKPFNRYTPSKSSTSKPISCGSEECSTLFSQCLPTDPTSECRYQANYASVNTSTSGRLVEDVVHLVPNSGAQTRTQVPVVLGCGQVQTGSFLDVGAPDGLLGLGLLDLSVPGLLAKSGVVQDSFSVCLGSDGTGRLVFGDLGSKTQTTTRFPKPSDPTAYDTYFVELESIQVGDESITVGGSALFDTGTTFTYLNSSIYQAYLSAFDKQTTDYKRIPAGTPGTEPWELCYQTTKETVKVAKINFVFGGKAPMTIQYPFQSLFFTTGGVAGFCLAVFESPDINIIGADYMIGQKLVFNRAERILGFEESDCYNDASNDGSVPGSPSTPGLSPAKAPASIPSPSGPRRSAHTPAPSPSGASAVSFSLITLLSLGLVHLLL